MFFSVEVNSRSSKLVPLTIAAVAIGTVCLIQTWIHFNSSTTQRVDAQGNVKTSPFEFLQRLELMTYDWRVRQAAGHNKTNAANLGFVALSDDSIEAMLNGSLGFQFGLYWPRQVYGRMLRELTAQGAKAVALDIMLAELRKDHPPYEHPDHSLQESDYFFADQLEHAKNVILAADPELFPHPLFLTNAIPGDVTNDEDFDGITRRAKAFRDVRVWHREVKSMAVAKDLDLRLSEAESDRIKLFRRDKTYFDALPIDTEGYFTSQSSVPDGQSSRAKPFFDVRLWHMGIRLASVELGLDLDHAQMDPRRNRIVLQGRNGIQRVIPIDRDGYFYISWTMKPTDRSLFAQSIEQLIISDQARAKGEPVSNLWKDRLLVVGSTATGNDLTDTGATPLEKRTLLFSKYWNIANSIITDRFINQAGLPVKLALIVALGGLGAYLSLELSALAASFWVLTISVLHIATSLFVFLQSRFWVPIVFPVVGGIFLTHVGIMTYRVIFEQNERKRVKAVFAKIVSPDVVNELLSSEKLSLGGIRRKITVYFADVRGFTEMTDLNQSKAEDRVRDQKLSGAEAEVVYEEQARETLATVNLYLATIADTVKKHGGTLDKYIGDCVMAFWGAPTKNEHHASDCVRAAIDAQRAMYALNQERFAENKRREETNVARGSSGLAPLPMLALLSLGSGINTGVAIVGLMGSDAHILNYTVFGREVNLASRLEGVSGRGRIIIGEATYADLKRDAPALAATCSALAPVMVKGIRGTVQIYEVPWKEASTEQKTQRAPSLSVPAEPSVVSGLQSPAAS